MIEKSKLLKAVLNRSVSQVQDCIVDGEDLHHKDEHGTYLHLSVFLRSNELVKFFLTEGVDVNETDQNYLTALHRACRTGCESIVELLILHGADVNAFTREAINPLHVAAGFGHARCVQVLCTKSKAIEIDCRDNQDNTPLHHAAAEGHAHAASILIKHGCDVEAENLSGNRPLHFAAASETPEMCQVLIQQGKAFIDARNHNDQTPLHFATQQACVNTVVELLRAKADPNIKDYHGNTCTHLALKSGNTDLVKIFLIDPRTDPSISDRDQNTVLHVALKLGHFNLVPMMLPRARDLTRMDGNGCSVIIEAIRNQLEDLALEMLHTCPSLVHTATNDLVTPLHLAAERGMTNLTKQLLIAGAQVDAADSSGLTPSLYCAKNDSVLECLAMIEDIMMVPDNSLDDNEQQQQQRQRQQQQIEGNSPKVSSRISS